MDHDSNAGHSIDAPSFWRSRNGIALCVLGAVAAFYLLTEHTAHVLGALPYVIFLVCPLMHLFMHHGHHHDHGKTPPTKENDNAQS